jgi:glycine cleavage system H protein
MRATQLPDHLRYSLDHQWVAVLSTTGSASPSGSSASGSSASGSSASGSSSSGSSVVVRTGMTDYAQDTLGALQFIGLPPTGRHVAATEPYADAEASKAVSDVYAPVSGVVVHVNNALGDDPSLINRDPYGDGWIVEIKVDDASSLESLLSPAAYRLLIGESDPSLEPASQAD